MKINRPLAEKIFPTGEKNKKRINAKTEKKDEKGMELPGRAKQTGRVGGEVIETERP